MAYEQVDIFVEEAGKPGVPVPGVLVRVYDATGATLFSESTTDESGAAGFLLSDQEYSLRFYKFQVGFIQPQRILVESGGTALNAFTVEATVLDKPLAVDARLCRCSGYFRDVTGAPRPHLDIHFIGTFRPLLLDDALVMDERRVLKTDKDGFGCIDLIRGACYSVTIEAWEGEQRLIRVPDAPCANLPDVLFPVVDSIDVAPVAIAVGAEQEITPDVLDSAGIPIEGTAKNDIVWSVADPAIAQLTIGVDTLTIKGLSTGTTELLAVRRDSSIVRIPDSGIDGSPVNITVG